MNVARWEAVRFHNAHRYVDESECISFAYEWLCRLAISYRPHPKGCFRKYFRMYVRLRFVDYLRDHGIYRRKKGVKHDFEQPDFQMVYEEWDTAVNESPEEYLIAFNSMRHMIGHKNAAGCKSELHNAAAEFEFFSREYHKI